jgi:hypothetical protein
MPRYITLTYATCICIFPVFSDRADFDEFNASFAPYIRSKWVLLYYLYFLSSGIRIFVPIFHFTNCDFEIIFHLLAIRSRKGKFHQNSKRIFVLIFTSTKPLFHF